MTKGHEDGLEQQCGFVGDVDFFKQMLVVEASIDEVDEVGERGEDGIATLKSDHGQSRQE